jgi:hypothetical protein
MGLDFPDESSEFVGDMACSVDDMGYGLSYDLGIP